jgi:RNA polymerase sigma factor (sigma-70 family)
VIEDLLPRVASGDRSAVEACLDRYGGLVWSIALRLCPSRADAEDVVQEIFIDLWKNASRFNPIRSSEVTFVAMIARRRAIDRRRASTRRDKRSAQAEIESIESSEHTRLEIAPDAKIAARVIQDLPDERRQVMKLSIYDGLTHGEISLETGLPLGTVKSHLRRGLAAVRARLKSAISQPGRAMT